MDDFLHNLRNQSKKPFDRNRNKPYDGQFRPNDRFAGRDRKGTPQRKPVENDQMPAIKRIIEGILDQQRRLAEFSERMAKAAERQAEAFEAIADSLQSRHPHSAETIQEATVTAVAVTDAPAADDPRGTAAAIILEQRAAGESFEQIAKALNTQGIATVSGKGQWRAQSVSRLYNTLVPPEAAAETDSTVVEA